MRRINPRVSIITPTFNHERYVRQCIDSVLAQSYQDWEQIVIDDGSIDGTAEIVQQVGDDRIHLVAQPHRGIFGLAETYNQALHRAHGDLIAILEGDDFWPPHKLTTLVPAFEDSDVVLAFGQTIATTPEGNPLGISIPNSRFIAQFGNGALLNTPVGAATRAMLYWPSYMYTFPCSVLLRGQALKAIGGFQHVVDLPFVDYQTFLTLSLRGRYSYTPQVMGYWRRHRRSATTTRRPDVTEARLLEFIRGFLRSYRPLIPLTPQDEAAIEKILAAWELQIYVLRGRAALAEGRWREARHWFRRSLEAGPPVTRMKRAVALVASYLHLDLEWLVTTRNQLFDREVRWTGVYRMPRASAPQHKDPDPWQADGG